MKQKIRWLAVAIGVPSFVVLGFFQNCSPMGAPEKYEVSAATKTAYGACYISGSWTANYTESADIFTLNGDCTGSISHCALTFNLSPIPGGIVDSYDMNVLTSSGAPECLSVGQHDCIVKVNSNRTSVSYSCDNDSIAMTYTSIPILPSLVSLSCDYRAATNLNGGTCYDIKNVSESYANFSKGACSAFSGISSSSVCSKNKRLGKCTPAVQVEGTTTISYYTPYHTLAAAKAACEVYGGVFE